MSAVVLAFVFAVFLLMWLVWLAAVVAIGAAVVAEAGRVLMRISRDASEFLGNRAVPGRLLSRADVQFLRDMGLDANGEWAACAD